MTDATANGDAPSLSNAHEALPAPSPTAAVGTPSRRPMSSPTASALSPSATVTAATAGGAPASKQRGGRIAVLTCETCGRVFRGDASTSGVQSNFKRHLLTHRTVRPFACRYCGAGFTTKQNMQRHARVVHAGLVTPQRAAAAPVDSQTAAPVPTRAPKASKTSTSRARRRRPTSSADASPGDSPSAAATPPARRPRQASPRPTGTAPAASQPPPFALPPATGAAPQSDAVSGPQRCCYCGRYFAWRSTRALHESTCLKRHAPSATGGDSASSTVEGSAGVVRDDTGELEEARRSPFTHVTAPSTTAFICPDCELEVSTRQGLRRHQRYYCPFRDDAFADPLEDAARRDYEGTAGGVDDDDDEKEEAVGATRAWAAQLAAQMGLSYYDNADRSSLDEGCSRGSSRDSRSAEGWGMGAGPHCAHSSHRSSDSSESEYLYIDSTSRGSSSDGTTSTRSLGDDVKVERWPEEQLHLDFKRRRGSRRRNRRILIRRLRAREHQSPLALPAQTVGVSPVARERWRTGAAATPPPDRSPPADGCATLSRAALAALAADVVTGSALHERAVALELAHSYHKPTARFTCPFDSCTATFSASRYLRAHVQRVHPAAYRPRMPMVTEDTTTTTTTATATTAAAESEHTPPPPPPP